MKKLSPFYYLFGILSTVYMVFILVTPSNSNTLTRFSLSVSTARALNLIVIIPFVAIWFAAFYGFIKVKEYAKAIRNTKDGWALKKIGDGLMVLAISLPLTSLAASMRTYIITQDSSLRATTNIIYNYFTLGLVLLGFYLINKGARTLIGTLQKRTYTLDQQLWGIAIVIFSAIYAGATLMNPNRRDPAIPSSTGAYYLPDWLILLTIVIPYIIVWVLGFGAAYYINKYRKSVHGSLYKQALGRLSAGIAFIVASTGLLRLLTSFTTFFNSLTLRLLLLVIYVLLIVIAVGYVLVAQSATKLKKIEEV